MISDALLGLVAGTALATLPGAATWRWALAGAASGAALGALAGAKSARLGLWWLPLLAFFVPALRLPVAPGADMAMHVALARGLLHGGLSPAWPGVVAHAYPRGLSALVALLSPVGLAKAGLVAAGASYAVFCLGLSTLVPAPVAVAAVFLSRTPQTFFDWGGNPTALALGAGFAAAGAAREGRALFAALLLAGSAAIHPMAACAAGVAAVAVCPSSRKSALACAAALAGLCAVLAVLALFGPSLSPRETAWIRDYASMREAVPLRSTLTPLGDAAGVVTCACVLLFVYLRKLRPVGLAAAGVAGCAVAFALLPRLGLYPVRFAPLLLLCVLPLWSALPRAVLALLLLVAIPFHLRWYQRAVPIATAGDLAAIDCAARTVPQGAVIDGAYGDGTQWIPALTGLAVTQPHAHVSLFDEIDASLARLPPPRFRFVGERMRYAGPSSALPSGATPLCGGHLFALPP